jgi:hypothetical protein
MDPGSLTSSRRGSPDIHLPYCWDDIQESSKYRAVLEIEKMASDLTRPHYKRASYMDGVNKENWCIQWMLWHSFRLYRQPIMPQVPAASSSPSVEGQDELGTPSTNSSRSSSNTAFACGTAAVMDRPSTSSSSIHSRGNIESSPTLSIKLILTCSRHIDIEQWHFTCSSSNCGKERVLGSCTGRIA